MHGIVFISQWKSLCCSTIGRRMDGTKKISSWIEFSSWGIGKNWHKKWNHSASVAITITRQHQDVLMCFSEGEYKKGKEKKKVSPKNEEGRRKLKSMWGTWRSWLRCKVFSSNSFWSINISHDAIVIFFSIHQNGFPFDDDKARRKFHDCSDNWLDELCRKIMNVDFSWNFRNEFRSCLDENRETSHLESL